MSLDTILNMDCLEGMSLIPNGSVSLVLADPPYEISKDSNFSKGKETGTDTDRFRISTDFGAWDQEGSFDIRKALTESYRCLRKGGYLICFYDMWKIGALKGVLEEIGFKQVRLIEWVKNNPMPANSKRNYLTNVKECAICAVKGSKPTFHSEYDKGIYYYPINHEKGRFHPTQKPLGLIQELVRKHSNEGDTVLDFSMGSGTTAVACIKENRHYMGFEIDHEYWAKSQERISECLASTEPAPTIIQPCRYNAMPAAY